MAMGDGGRRLARGNEKKARGTRRWAMGGSFCPIAHCLLPIAFPNMTLLNEQPVWYYSQAQTL